MPKIEELERTLKIDKHDLDNELVRNREVFWQVAKAAADARREYELIVLEVKELHAKIDAELRTGDKISETQIKERIVSDKRMRDLKRDEIEAEHQLDLLNALVESAKIRGYDLGRLAELWSQQYFAAESGGARRQDSVDRQAERNIKEAGYSRPERAERRGSR